VFHLHNKGAGNFFIGYISLKAFGVFASEIVRLVCVVKPVLECSS